MIGGGKEQEVSYIKAGGRGTGEVRGRGKTGGGREGKRDYWREYWKEGEVLRVSRDQQRP